MWHIVTLNYLFNDVYIIAVQQMDILIASFNALKPVIPTHKVLAMSTYRNPLGCWPKSTDLKLALHSKYVDIETELQTTLTKKEWEH